MENLVRKSVQVFNRFRYPGIRSEHRAAISANHTTRVLENKWAIHDYLWKPKYKEISFSGEFGMELIYVLPFAYWHHMNGTLSKTVSSKQTREFYFFSQHHEEVFEQRKWRGWSHTYGIPNMLHCNTISYKKWLRVPLKEHYQNNIFEYDKPLLIVANKYNVEWNKPPINYLDKPTLHAIFEKFKERYQIIYNRPVGKTIVMDNSEILDLNEHQWIREEHPEVLLMNDLYAENMELVSSFNHLQLMVYANCSHFISVQGGAAALASYFGGTNLIYSKKGYEHYFREFETIYPAVSGAKIVHVNNREDALQWLNRHYA